MIFFLYGKDNFRSLEKLKEIIAGHQKIHQTGLNLRFFDCQEHIFEDFRDQLRTKSMFREKKLFVLRNVFSNSLFKQALLEYKQELTQTQNIILFYEKEDPPVKDSLFIWLQENSTSQRFDLLKNRQLESWIKKELEKHQAEIEPAALKLLIEYVGNDLWQLSNELQKLVNYKKGAKRITIFQEDVKTLTPQKLDTNIFKTIDFIAEKQKQKAISLIHKHLQKGDSPLYLLSMITFQFRNLLVLKSRLESQSNGRMIKMSTLTRQLGMHPFVVRKSLILCQKFSLEELKKIYQKIFQIDLAIKTGQIEPELALDLFIAQI